MTGVDTIKMKEMIVGDFDVLKVQFLMQTAGYDPTVKPHDVPRPNTLPAAFLCSSMPDHLSYQMDVKFYDKIVNVDIWHTSKFVTTSVMCLF